MSTDHPKSIRSKIKAFWLKYEAKIVLVIGFILVATISFEAGILKGQKWQQEPLIIEKAPVVEVVQAVQNNPSQAQNLPPVSQDSTLSAKDTNQNSSNKLEVNCAFVGSKNSNKYHLPTCRWAKQIKPENLVCFSSVDDAVAKSYQSDKNCIK